MPIKDPYFATLKSNNYLPNALVALDAQLEGFDQVCLLHHFVFSSASCCSFIQQWRCWLLSLSACALSMRARSEVSPFCRVYSWTVRGMLRRAQS